MEYAFVCLDNKSFLVLPVLVADEFFELLLSFPLDLIAFLLKLLLNLVHWDSATSTDCEELTLQLRQVPFNSLDSLLGFIALNFHSVLLVVVRVVTRVQYIILDRVWMVG